MSFHTGGTIRLKFWQAETPVSEQPMKKIIKHSGSMDFDG